MNDFLIKKKQQEMTRQKTSCNSGTMHSVYKTVDKTGNGFCLLTTSFLCW